MLSYGGFPLNNLDLGSAAIQYGLEVVAMRIISVCDIRSLVLCGEDF